MGIFGEGTDSPSLNAVAFLEARKSPIDVIQAVGRAMRIAPGKEIGYIICPILIPPNADPESWLSTSNMEEGWQELGQILLALRAHDQRIEDNLAGLLQLYVPKPPEVQRTIVAIASGEDKRISYREHEGAPGQAQEAVELVLEGKSTLSAEFDPIVERQPAGTETAPNGPADTTELTQYEGQAVRPSEPLPSRETSRAQTEEPTQIVTGKKNDDGSVELRMDTIARAKPKLDGTRGRVDVRRSKAKAKDMINKGTGVRLPHSSKQRSQRRTRQEMAEHSAMQMLLLTGMEEHGNAIRMNLLSKSGLVDNRVVRDLNILETSIKEAAHHLTGDGLRHDLDRHFGLDNLKESELKKQADGCTIAALLMMNAAMLHQRIANGRWLPGVSDLEAVKNDVNVVRRIGREWNQIMRHDFRPVLEPAVKAIETIEDTGKLAGLERALRHIAAEAERLAETYADMGADHAGPLFNRVMGNQASDGAYFTRPTAASIAARLTLDACDDADWSDPTVWKEHKIVDLACGSGTLLAAMLTDMKRRAVDRGASIGRLAELQKLGVEETIKGLDINPVSLQLAASQLTAGNQEIRYRRMGLHLMPYGPHQDDPTRISVGTLELLAQKAIVPRDSELALPDDQIASQVTWSPPDDTELEDAVSAVNEARVIIMNPPFTNRAKMGEKFPKAIQQALRSRADDMESLLVRADVEMARFTDKNAIEPLFTALADRCTNLDTAVVTMINPTIALCATSAQHKRRILAERYHIHTVLTGRLPREFTLSQNVEIDECMVVAVRQADSRPPTRFIHLDRMPHDEDGVAELHRALLDCPYGPLDDGWGEVSYWPSERIAEGDWTPAIWRSSKLAEAARRFANDDSLQSLDAAGLSAHQTGRELYTPFERGSIDSPNAFPVIKSKGADGQSRIQSSPDQYWVPKEGYGFNDVQKFLRKREHLLITEGQDNRTSRLVAVASDEKYVGGGWMPVEGLTADEAKATAVFLNGISS